MAKQSMTINDLAEAMSASFGSLEEYLAKRFDGVDARFDGVEARSDGHDEKFESIESDTKSIKSDLYHIRIEIGTINQRLDTLEQLIKEDSGAFLGEIVELRERVKKLESQVRKLQAVRS